MLGNSLVKVLDLRSVPREVYGPRVFAAASQHTLIRQRRQHVRAVQTVLNYTNILKCGRAPGAIYFQASGKIRPAARSRLYRATRAGYKTDHRNAKILRLY